jgi:hypothetical protein
MGWKRNAYRGFVGKPEGNIPLEDVGGRMILRWILQTDRIGWYGLD